MDDEDFQEELRKIDRRATLVALIFNAGFFVLLGLIILIFIWFAHA